jgi:hypothetical protein
LTAEMTGMSEQTDYAAARSKGERFLERGNFPLAKRALEVAQRLQPSDELAAKLRQCEAGILAQNAKEAAKRGRKLEKKGKLGEALRQFEQAQAASPEDWLPQKIDQLRQQIGRNAIVATIEHAERAQDWGALLATYDQLLAGVGVTDSEQQALGEKRLIALVRLERYDEARAWGREHPPSGASARYHLGYALAAQGAYLEALHQWLALPPGHPGLRPQLMVLIPLAYREASGARAAVPVELYERLMPVLKDETAFAPLLIHFKWRSIDSLWRQGCCQEVARLMLPLPQRLSLAELGPYARLMLQLAEGDIEQLQIAISLWLTAIHNTPLLERLAVHRAVSVQIPLGALRGALQQELEQLLDRYDREGRLGERLQRHYRMERRVIEALTDWALPREADIWPCTPAFAARFGMSSAVLERLEAWRGRDTWDESIFSVAVYFSSGGHSLLLAEAGAVDEALAELPKAVDNDRLERYCRQRVAWLCGIDRALAGNAKGTSYLMEALPLLADFPHHRQELIGIALGERSFRERVGLADAMEWLARRLDDAEFREATASLLCQKAIFLANEGGARSTYRRLVDQAAVLSPTSDLVDDTYAQLERHQEYEQLGKAFKKGKLSSAVAIIERADWDEELIEYFFSVLGHWIEEIESPDIDPGERLAGLQEFLLYAQQVDPAHPLNARLRAAIARLQK